MCFYFLTCHFFFWKNHWGMWHWTSLKDIVAIVQNCVQFYTIPVQFSENFARRFFLMNTKHSGSSYCAIYTSRSKNLDSLGGCWFNHRIEQTKSSQVTGATCFVDCLSHWCSGSYFPTSSSQPPSVKTLVCGFRTSIPFTMLLFQRYSQSQNQNQSMFSRV